MPGVARSDNPRQEPLPLCTDRGPTSRKWGLDRVLPTMVHNAHIGRPCNPDDPNSSLKFPESPVTMYRFLQSSDCEIDGTWDCTDRCYQPSSSIGCRPPWSMDVPEAIIMRAVGPASNGLRNPTKQNRVGKSLDCMNEIIRETPNAQVTSRIFLHVMKAEDAACREHMYNKSTNEQSQFLKKWERM